MITEEADITYLWACAIMKWGLNRITVFQSSPTPFMIVLMPYQCLVIGRRYFAIHMYHMLNTYWWLISASILNVAFYNFTQCLLTVLHCRFTVVNIVSIFHIILYFNRTNKYIYRKTNLHNECFCSPITGNATKHPMSPINHAKNM